MKRKVILCISSLTGNTRKIAEGLEEELKRENYEISILNNKVDDNIQDEDALFIICFWCRRSTLDFASMKTVDILRGKDVLAFGTMGSYTDSSYGERVRQNAHDYISRENNCLGVYLSQGKVSLKSTERRRNLPKDNPHYLDDEGLKRHLDSQSHPDENDIKQAVLFLRENLHLIEDLHR